MNKKIKYQRIFWSDKKNYWGWLDFGKKFELSVHSLLDLAKENNRRVQNG